MQLSEDFFFAFYQQVCTNEIDKVFQVVSTDNVWIPEGHSTILPAHIPGCKCSAVELPVRFEPLERFKVENEVSADHA